MSLPFPYGVLVPVVWNDQRALCAVTWRPLDCNQDEPDAIRGRAYSVCSRHCGETCCHIDGNRQFDCR